MPSAGHVEDSISIQLTTESQSDLVPGESREHRGQSIFSWSCAGGVFPQMGASLVKTEASGAAEEPCFLSVDEVRSL